MSVHMFLQVTKRATWFTPQWTFPTRPRQVRNLVRQPEAGQHSARRWSV